MKTFLIATVLVSVVACSPQDSSATSACNDAIGAAQAADEAFRSAMQESRAVVPDPLDPGLRRTVEEGEWISPAAEAEVAAESKARRERERLEGEARGKIFRWATIVEQNPDCFDVDTRATAAQVLHEMNG